MVAVLTTQAVVPESYGLPRTLTPRERARSTTSSSTGRPPVTMIPRSPSSIARSWTSRRSPTMMIDCAAGIPSLSDIFQNERMSMVPRRT